MADRPLPAREDTPLTKRPPHPSGRPLRHVTQPKRLSIPRIPPEGYLTPSMRAQDGAVDAIGFVHDFTAADDADGADEDRRR